MLATARTFSLIGVAAREVRVEVDVRSGLPTFQIVGLPDPAVREARERVRAALSNSGFEFPLKRIVANLAPGDLRKEGPAFDLAIAAALLAASGQLDPALLETCAVVGELALDGSIHPVLGALAMAEEARRVGIDAIGVPATNGAEAALVENVRVLALPNLEGLAALASGEWQPTPVESDGVVAGLEGLPDIADLRGQPYLRRALEVAAAGAHSLLMVGPPGAGKSLAARRLPSLLPPLDRAETVEVVRVAGACGRTAPGAPISRPFRAPHHTVSPVGLVGGGNPPRAGEVTLAHGGVLFLDELGEFPRAALEALRQPLEEGNVTLSRARHTVELPCRFILVAAANPCPCGRGEGHPECRCAAASVRAYRARLSGALADRIDMSLAVEQPEPGSMNGEPGEGSEAVRDRVAAARRRQTDRFGPGTVNGHVSLDVLRPGCRLEGAARRLLAESQASLGLSGRGHDRVLRVARTIADLAASERVAADHVGEAIALRRRMGGDR